MSTVSVIIPTFNRASLLKEAIDSALTQGLPDLEVIVVDDGSTDDTAAVLSAYGDHIVARRQPNQSAPVARNNGVAVARGDYLVFLDSDDRLLPGSLVQLAAALDANPALGLVVGGFRFVDASGAPIREVRPWANRPAFTLENLLFGGLSSLGAAMLRRAWLPAVGGFDPAIRCTDDMDLWFRLYLAGCPMAWVPIIVSEYRVHNGNITRDPAAFYQSQRDALDKLFARDDLPPEATALRAGIYAQKYLAEAAHRHAAGDETGAADCLARALELDPELTAGDGAGLGEAVARLEDDIWLREAHGFGPFVLAQLDPTLRPRIARQAALAADKRRFFEAHYARDRRAVRRYWPRVLRRDPAWLLNRGGWAMLYRAIMGQVT